MSVNQGSIATHIPQSLPSFAQAFSTQSLGSISAGNNSLPPIQTHFSPMDNRRVNSPSVNSQSRTSSDDNSTASRAPSRKRSRNDVTSTPRDDDHPNSHGSPRLVHIKEEQDQDMLDPDPHSPPARPPALPDTGAPPPSSLFPSPLKKRRVTISGAPHPLNTDVRAPVDQTNSTPISPVVMGFTIQRDNPSAIEQVRSMITVKQKQKALIEQRRGSVAGIMSPSVATGSPVPPTAPAEEKISAPPKPASRSLRRSPNTGSGVRRLTHNPSQGNQRPPSPSPVIIPSQQQAINVPNQPISTHTLPPPPISFAKRRAGQLGAGKKKPADILISPRDAHTPEQFQPAIQSAPPVPHAGQSFYSGRIQMALPRLPSVMGGGDNPRRFPGNVPPTPTRLAAMQRGSQSTGTTPPISNFAGRSPPAASVPIASTLVPPTPNSLHRPGYSGDKSAFLAPFEVFYEALNDSKQLKKWLGEQLQRSNTMMQSLTQQQEKLNEVVESLVEKRVAGMQSEMMDLRQRVEELEDALRSATSGRRHSTDISGGSKPRSKPLRNGNIPMASDTYTFPPTPSTAETSRGRPGLVRRVSSPGWESREHSTAPEAGDGPPAHFDSMRVSASRLDLPRPSPAEQQLPRASSAKQSPPQGTRDIQTLSPPSTHGKAAQGSHSHSDRERLGRQPSTHGTSEQMGSPPLRRADGHQNVNMSPPDAQGDDG